MNKHLLITLGEKKKSHNNMVGEAGNLISHLSWTRLNMIYSYCRAAH